jgi:hypothetical protein
LPAFVKPFGIDQVSLEKKGLNLRFVGKKVKHVTWEDLESLEIYAHANRFGKGKDRVSVGFARKKIQEFQNNHIG